MTEDDIISMIDSAAKEYTREPTKEEILENATLDDLDDLEDDEDDKILEMYRFVKEESGLGLKKKRKSDWEKRERVI